jgi:hypothetical protein
MDMKIHVCRTSPAKKNEIANEFLPGKAFYSLRAHLNFEVGQLNWDGTVGVQY